MAEIVRRRSWGGVLPLGRHASISGSRSIHAPSVSIALSSFQEGQNARHHNQFKLEQALTSLRLCRIMLSSAARIFAVGTYIAFAVAASVICAQAVQDRA